MVSPISSKVKKFLGARGNYIVIGLFNLVLFHYAIIRLWFFLYDSHGRQESDSLVFSFIINTLLVLFFSIPHSALLSSKIKTKILQYVPNALFGTIYSIHACVAIILLDEYWVQIGADSFFTTEWIRNLQIVGYVASWLFMFYAMLSTGLFRQSGIEQWFKGLRKQKFKNDIPYHGAYTICRHPIYAAFLGMIWFTPNMNWDHLFLSVSWTIYIFVGMTLKEKRLMRNKGYQAYMEHTPALPLLPRVLDIYRREMM